MATYRYRYRTSKMWPPPPQVSRVRRIGEVLIASGVLDEARLAEALRAQVMWGGRLGTALVELGHVGLDDLAIALGRQHRMPAALASHFERADPALRLPTRLAERLACMPLVAAGPLIVIASMSPLCDAAAAAVGDALEVAPELLIRAIAPELRIRYFLEYDYGIARPPRFLRMSGTESRMFADMPAVDEARAVAPSFDGVPLAAAVELPSSAAAAVAGVRGRAGTADDRRYVETLADVARADLAEARERIADAPRLTSAMSVGADANSGELATALGQIERGGERDDVARLATAAIARFEPAVEAALLLSVRGAAAGSWTGFCRNGAALPAVAVPLDQPGLVPAVLCGRACERSASEDLGTIDYLLLASLGAPDGDLAIVPLAIADRVVAVFALAITANEPIAYVDAIARAAAAGFARLMRETKPGVSSTPEKMIARVDLRRPRSSPG